MEATPSTASKFTATDEQLEAQPSDKLTLQGIRVTRCSIVNVPRLLSYDELPTWYQDNPHIQHGYRPESLSTKACFASWAYLHNETFNIYSHLIPALIFLACQPLLHTQIDAQFPGASAKEHVIVALFLAAASITLSLSFTYHTLMNHSMRVCHLWVRLDYIGILILTLGDFISGIYLVFYCDEQLQWIYWGMILSLGLITSFLVINPRLQGLKYRTLRVLAFVATGLSGFAPLAHGLVIYGWSHMWAASGMPYYLLEGLLLCIGTAFYATRCPEALRPGRFDLWGCSHNVFHVFVVLATVVHAVGVWEALGWEFREGRCAWT